MSGSALVGKDFWAEYKKRTDEVRAAVERQTEEHEEVLEIVEPSRRAGSLDSSTAILKTLGLLALAGFWTAAQTTVVRQLGTLIKSGDKEGQMRPDKELINVFIHAAHPDRRIVSAWYQDGKLRTANVGRAHEALKLVERAGELEEFIG